MCLLLKISSVHQKLKATEAHPEKLGMANKPDRKGPAKGLQQET